MQSTENPKAMTRRAKVRHAVVQVEVCWKQCAKSGGLLSYRSSNKSREVLKSRRKLARPKAHHIKKGELTELESVAASSAMPSI
jgi:hypothetical protein